MASTSIARSPTPCPTCHGSGEILLHATWEQPEDHADCLDCDGTGAWQPPLWSPEEDTAWAAEPLPTPAERHTRHLVRAWLDAPSAEAALDCIVALGRGVV